MPAAGSACDAVCPMHRPQREALDVRLYAMRPVHLGLCND
jgi:hypothetical protein